MSLNRNVLPATEYPRPHGPILARADLRPADVLLSRGETDIANLIVAADRGSFSHAALWTGDTIIEATMKGGVEEHAPKGRRYVYRYRDVHAESPEAEALSPAQAAVVIERARDQVNNAYATTEIHLLAVVFQKWWPTGRPRRSLAGALLEALGGSTASKLRDWVQSVYVRSAPRICSELVALAFFQEGPALYTVALARRPPPPADEVRVLPDRTAPSSDPELDTVEQSKEFEDLEVNVSGVLAQSNPPATEDAAPPDALPRGMLWGDLAYDLDTELPVGVVTPGDLQFSPSLYFVGIFDPE